MRRGGLGIGDSAGHVFAPAAWYRRGMKPLRSHRELKVYQAAMAAQKRVFQLTLRFPSSEKFALIPQTRGSSRGVSGAIGEAWRKRRFPAHWVSKLTDAESEAAETQIWMETARDCDYITSEEFEEVFDSYEKIISQLVLMASNPKDWCIPYNKRSPQRPSASSQVRRIKH